MNTLIDDNIKKLLYEKGWRYDLSTQGHRVKHSLGEARFNDGNFCYVDISIAEVVMWLYEKYGIWIGVIQIWENESSFIAYATQNETVYDETVDGEQYSYYTTENIRIGKYDTPNEAYLEAIVYTLNSLI